MEMPRTETKLSLVENATTVWLKSGDHFVVVLSRVEYDELDDE